jgi:hypothetical protein
MRIFNVKLSLTRKINIITSLIQNYKNVNEKTLFKTEEGLYLNI